MWRVIFADDIELGHYMQAATFDVDILDLAKQINARVAHATEDTGPIKVIGLAGPNGKFAMLVSHECGDPKSIEIRLPVWAGKTDWAMSNTDLQGVLSLLECPIDKCTWVCPLVLPDGRE